MVLLCTLVWLLLPDARAFLPALQPLTSGGWDCGPLDNNQCVTEGCSPILPTSIDGQRRTCILRRLSSVFDHSPGHMRLAFVGASDSGKSTCLNSILAFTLRRKPLPEGAGKERQNTQFLRIEPTPKSQVLLFDTPGFRFEHAANSKIRDALVRGVADRTNTELPLQEWPVDPDNGIDRFVHVVNVQHAVDEGPLWNTVDEMVVADWAAAFDTLDGRSNYSPVLVINTYGYNPFTVARVRAVMHNRFSRIQSNAVFELDCKRVDEVQLAKMFTVLLMQELE